MKSKTMFISVCGLALLCVCCKEKELDSPDITVFSPVSNQVFLDKDSIQIKARIEPKNTSVTNSRIMVKDKKGYVLASMNMGCDCGNLSVVDIERKFLYPVKKKQDVTLEICASLGNGETICETIPFVISK